jgi:CRP-like cAMP-binding protein
MIDIEQIRNAELFAGLDDGELLTIAPLCNAEFHAQGTIIWKEGDVADRVYILKKGSVQINLRGKSTIDILEPGPQFNN